MSAGFAIDPATVRAWTRYPAYKDSGVAWLGEVPAGWEVKRLKYLCQTNPSKSEVASLPKDTMVSFLPMELVGEDCSLTLTQNKPISDVWEGYTYFRNGDVIVAKITPCFENGKGALCDNLTSGIAFGTTELHVLRAGEKMDPKFLFLTTKSYQFRTRGADLMTGTAGQKRVPDAFIRDYPVGVPPLPEQRAIAAFLDRETARLDALIAKKQRFIELLEEKRQAVISHAVTKGLDPDAEMKDSGVEWLGEVPDHWSVMNLGAAIKLQRGYDLPEKERTEGTVPLVSSAGISAHHGEAMVRGPGVVTGRYGTIGKVFYVEQDFWPLNTTLYVKEFRGNYSRFVQYMLMNVPFSSDSDKSAVPGVNRNYLHTLTVAIPPTIEQGEIADYILTENEKSHQKMNNVSRSIDKLHKYRTALISAAVTGKIDVRCEAAP